MEAEVIADIKETCKDLGLLIGKGPQNGNVSFNNLALLFYQ